MITKNYLTSTEAAAYLGVKMNYLYKLTHLKKIPYYSPGGKKILFKESELNAFIEKSRVASNEELEYRCDNMPSIEEMRKRKQEELEKKRAEEEERKAERRKNIKTYIMMDFSTCYYKIGCSVDPEYRENTLQSEKPTIELLYICENFCETELHREYKDKRVRGEWFDLSSGDLQKIIKKYGFKKA